MKTEELKQEAIKKAYGEHWEDVEDYVFKNGWCNSRFDVETEFESDRKKNHDVYWRPKSLAGIETNNGWIRIEDDGSNLPKERCIVWIKEKTTGLIDYCKFESSFFTPLHRSCTHYQPITKPNPPIY